MTKPDYLSSNVEALKSLRKDSTTAWLDPDGRLHVVPLFNHLRFFLDNPEALPDATEMLSRFVTDRGELAILGFHMARAMNLIYSRGWGRVGTYGGDRIELDCDGDHVDALRRKAKHSARAINRALVCRVAKPIRKTEEHHPPLARDAVWSSMRVGFVGWMSPTGDIFETPPDAPFSIFVDDPDRIPELAKALEDAVELDKNEQKSEFSEGFLEAYPDEGHMPWHQFWHRPFNPSGEALGGWTECVLSHGWGRLRVETEGVVELYASPQNIEALIPSLKEAIRPTGLSVASHPLEGGPSSTKQEMSKQ